MILDNSGARRTLQQTLYGGIALIIVSMLFMVRGFQSESFLAHTILVMAAPVFFYGVGAVVMRYLNAPLAGPGIVAAGAWLVAVGLFHLYLQQSLLPEFLQPYSWLTLSVIATVLITATGLRVHTWLLVPLVPLTQINAVWSVMAGVGLAIGWWPALTFGLVWAWWEIRDEAWSLVYKVSAGLMIPLLLTVSMLLSDASTASIVAAWSASAVLIAYLGIRYGIVDLAPLAIILLTCASMWGLPPHVWPLAWLILSTITILLVERLAERHPASVTLEISMALAVMLSGAAGFAAAASPLLRFMDDLSPMYTALILLEAGVVLAWLGWQWMIRIASHVGLWLIAAAWAQFYFAVFNDREVFGLWLSLLAAVALLAERIFASLDKRKHKKHQSLGQTVMQWPLADLALGLSAIIVVWMFMHLQNTTPMIVAITMLVTVMVWIIAGLLYRLPVLLHVALWMAPLPYGLLLLYVSPAFRSLNTLALAWQGLSIIYVVIGHSLYKHRPAMVMPFFVAGYGILGASMTLLLDEPMMLTFSVGIVAIISLMTSAAVVSGFHPAWTALVSRFILPAERPYAFRSFHNAFLVLGVWLAVVWIQLLLGYSSLSFSRQGIVLVVLSAAFIALGRVLPRIPDAVGWPVYAAGLLMWLMGLLQVFFVPQEALFVIIFGLAVSVEGMYRSREIYWMPVFVLQILFTALQLTYLLSLPSATILTVVMAGISLAGLALDRNPRSISGVAALTGGSLLLVMWLRTPADYITTLSLSVVLLAAAYRYLRVEFLLMFFTGAGVYGLLNFETAWQAWMLVGGVLLNAGVIAAKHLRPRRHTTLKRMLFDVYDWASPLLWFGVIYTGAGATLALSTVHIDVLTIFALLTAISVATALISGWRQAPVIAMAVGGATLAIVVSGFSVAVVMPTCDFTQDAGCYMQLDCFMQTLCREGTPFTRLMVLSLGMTAAATAVQVALIFVLAPRRPFAHMRRLVWWLRPLNLTAKLLIPASMGIALIAWLFYRPDYVLLAIYTALLAINFAVQYSRWCSALMIALLMLALTWIFALNAMSLTGLQWYCVPLGIAMMLVARALHKPEYDVLEPLGIGVFLLAAFPNLYENGLTREPFLFAVGQIVFLAGYGIVAQRRIPFLSAGLVAGVGIAIALILLNIWLLPLAAGVALVGFALILEVRGDIVRQWFRRCVRVWQSWQ